MRNAGGLKELREAPDLQPARKWRPQSYDHKELNLADNLNNLKSRSSAEALERKAALPIPCFAL